MRAAPPDLESLSAQEVFAHVVGESHPRLYVACSLQEATVIRDMQPAIEPAARVFALDTGVLPPETYDFPYHPQHDRGYRSIGCTHCTSPGGGREGHWAGTDKIGCGLHLPAS